jgi:hypothetical protein
MNDVPQRKADLLNGRKCDYCNMPVPYSVLTVVEGDKHLCDICLGKYERGILRYGKVD